MKQITLISAEQNQRGTWIFPQVYFDFDGKEPLTWEQITTRMQLKNLLQDMVAKNQEIAVLVIEAEQERCVLGYSFHDRFYEYYKPCICDLVGWGSQGEYQGSEYYDALYEAIYALLPCDEKDLYPKGVMPNGQTSPSFQKTQRHHKN